MYHKENKMKTIYVITMLCHCMISPIARPPPGSEPTRASAGQETKCDEGIIKPNTQPTPNVEEAPPEVLREPPSPETHLENKKKSSAAAAGNSTNNGRASISLYFYGLGARRLVSRAVQGVSFACKVCSVLRSTRLVTSLLSFPLSMITTPLVRRL